MNSTTLTGRRVIILDHKDSKRMKEALIVQRQNNFNQETGMAVSQVWTCICSVFALIVFVPSSPLWCLFPHIILLEPFLLIVRLKKTTKVLLELCEKEILFSVTI